MIFSRKIGRHRPSQVKQVPYEEALSQHINAVDAQGNKYTTHAFGFDGDWWRGALILTPRIVEELRQAGKLPLTEVMVPV